MTALPQDETRDPEVLRALEEYRAQIDVLDAELMDVIVRRFAVARKIGALKSSAGMSVVSPVRAAMVIERAGKVAESKGLDPEFIRKFYTLMLDVIHAIDYAHAGKSDDQEKK
jgi:chorismate mutase